MERRDAFELYTDYLVANQGLATSTGLSALLDENLKHDYISDSLAQQGLDQKAFWKEVKPFVRKIENEESVISIDDTIIKKPHSTENEVVNYHFDHTTGKSTKGINLLNFLLSSEYEQQIVNSPLAYHVVRKSQAYTDKDGKTKYKSEASKNEVVLEQLRCLTFLNQVKYKYILFDSWFSSSKSLKYIHTKLEKVFVCPLKSNRLVALDLQDKKDGKFVNVSTLSFDSQEPLQVYVKGLEFPVSLVREVFTNKDRSTGVLYLISNDTSLTYDQLTTIYQKRWKVEEFHKSLKQNTLLGNSPTKMEVSQCNHIFASMLAYVQLERLKVKERLNHFALKAKLHLVMLKAAFDQLQVLKAA